MKDAARQAIQTALNAAWALTPPCHLVWDNQPKNHDPKEAWARASLQFGATQSAAVGREFTRTTALLAIQVYIPEGQGTRIAVLAADRSDAAFMFTDLAFLPGTGVGKVSGDQGCTGPTPAGQEAGFQQYNLFHTLRLDVKI